MSVAKILSLQSSMIKTLLIAYWYKIFETIDDVTDVFERFL